MLDARTFHNCRTSKIHSLFAIVCTRITLIVTAFVIARQFKAQSTYFLSNTKMFTNFVGGAKLEGPATKKNCVRDLKSFEIFRDLQIYKGFI